MGIKNIKEVIKVAFKNLEFREVDHVYNIGDKILPSVSGIKKQYENNFDADKIAGFVARKQNKTKEEILVEWENIKNEACENGTKVHEYAENYGKKDLQDPSSKQEEAAKKFWDELPVYYVPVFFELQMYHKKKEYAGTADLILYDKRKRSLIICDYKTNKDLFKNYKNQKLKAPFTDLLDNPFNKYQIQLSLYQMMIEQLGVPVSARYVINLKRNGTYEIMLTENYTKKIEESLKIL